MYSIFLAHNDDALEKYHLLYNEWKLLDRELSELTALAEQSRTDEDYLRFQLEQLEEAHPGGRGAERTGAGGGNSESCRGDQSGALSYRTVFFSDEGGLLSFLKDNLNTLNNLKRCISLPEN